MTAKHRAIRRIAQLPDDATIDDIIERLYVQLKIEKGLRELDAGKSFTHAQVKERMRKWTG